MSSRKNETTNVGIVRWHRSRWGRSELRLEGGVRWRCFGHEEHLVATGNKVTGNNLPGICRGSEILAPQFVTVLWT